MLQPYFQPSFITSDMLMGIWLLCSVNIVWHLEQFMSQMPTSFSFINVLPLMYGGDSYTWKGQHANPNGKTLGNF